VRNVRERNRRRDGAVASLGKHYPDTDSEPNPDSHSNIDAIYFSRPIDTIDCVAILDLRISNSSHLCLASLNARTFAIDQLKSITLEIATDSAHQARQT
jgi:hypothetical protein